MAQILRKKPENVPGAFYVDDTCIDCDACRWLAPEVFQAVGEQSAVYHQPENEAETMKALQALVACPTASIGARIKSDLITEVSASFPLLIDGKVFYCGYHSEDSFGAASYFIQRKKGNILIDSPRFAKPLVDNLEKLGGVRYLFLTHKDDVADHALFRKHFNCERILHAADITPETEEIEIRIEGREPVSLGRDIKLIPVPGHTRGHAALLYQDKFLFTGDHLAWSEEQGQLTDEIRAPAKFDPLGYSDNFLTYTADFNGDGWTDVFYVPFPGAEGFWHENPQNKTGHWLKHLAYSMVGNESPGLADVNGDGRPDLILNNEGYLGYASFDRTKPNEPWKFHAVSQKDSRFQRFTHGVGAGDINSDGRIDLIEAAGWWEQPTDTSAETVWKFHPYKFAEAAAQMLVTDVDGDGLNDVINSWHCHRYGLAWYRQSRFANGDIAWEQKIIMSPTPDPSLDALRFSQLHAMELADMNGDGLKDIITGKRYWAHGPVGDVEPDAPAVVYWFELKRTNGQASFIPHLIDNDSGVGTQVTVTDLNADKRPDVIVANKKGIYLHLNQATTGAAQKQ